MSAVTPAQSRRPRRRATSSTPPGFVRSVLAVISVAAIAAAFGPLWAERVGLIVAVTGAVFACAYAERELRSERRRRAADLQAAARAHAEALHAERVHNSAVVETLSARAARAAATAEEQRSMAGKLQQVVAELRGQLSTATRDRAQLLHELEQREQTLAAMRLRVAVNDRELAKLRAAHADAASAGDPAEPHHVDGQADVHRMPRRARTDGAVLAAVLEPDDGVVDLATLQTAVVLPNYEVDRRLA